MENRKEEFKDARQNYRSQLWSGHLRFFRSLITAMKVPKLVELAKTALAEDKCVVIGLQSTGEAHAKRIREKLEAAAAAEDIQEDMLSAPQETLRYVVRKVWGNELAEVERLKAVAERAAARVEALAKEEADAAAAKAAAPHVDDGLSDSDEDMEDTAALLKKPLGNKNSSPSKRRSSDAKLDVWGFDDSQEDSQAGEEGEEGEEGAAGVGFMMDLDDETEWIKAFSEKIDALKLPGNALDMLIDDLGGFNKIAEMSGRSERLVRNYKGDFYTQKRSEANQVSMNEQNL